MAKQFKSISPYLQGFIEEQHMFFVATAAPDGMVNVSPKGSDSLRVLGPNRVLWRNLTGSGNETAGHLLQANRMTLMWCSFTTRPMILRVYGSARTLYPQDDDWQDLHSHFPPLNGARQLFDVKVDLVQTSCGYAVPYYQHQGDRDTLATWTDAKGAEGLKAYWKDVNRQTLDGDPTGIPDE